MAAGLNFKLLLYMQKYYVILNLYVKNNRALPVICGVTVLLVYINLQYWRVRSAR